MRKHDRIIDGRKFWRVGVDFDKRNAGVRARLERRDGHKARVIKVFPGGYWVYVDYNPYKR